MKKTKEQQKRDVERMNFAGKSIKRGNVTLREVYMFELGEAQGKQEGFNLAIKRVQDMMKNIIKQYREANCSTEILNYILEELNKLQQEKK